MGAQGRIAAKRVTMCRRGGNGGSNGGHINLTGDYVWSAADDATENRDGLRSLRPAPDPALLAA
jgi:hypothetical protein